MRSWYVGDLFLAVVLEPVVTVQGQDPGQRARGVGGFEQPGPGTGAVADGVGQLLPGEPVGGPLPLHSHAGRLRHVAVGEVRPFARVGQDVSDQAPYLFRGWPAGPGAGARADPYPIAADAEMRVLVCHESDDPPGQGPAPNVQCRPTQALRLHQESVTRPSFGLTHSASLRIASSASGARPAIIWKVCCISGKMSSRTSTPAFSACSASRRLSSSSTS